jgi:hypothetical protein
MPHFSVGRSLPWNNHVDITYGVYLTGMGFENNTNFFTYGHGGYYRAARFRVWPCCISRQQFSEVLKMPV